jgi:hypothetical protein
VDEIADDTNMPTGHAYFKYQIIRNPGSPDAEVLRESSRRLLGADDAIGNRLAHASVTSSRLSSEILRELMGAQSFIQR